MARQIEYDPSALKQNLLSVFWEQGFAETSLSDLEHATGLNRRQLYNGVGDKRAMFLQALDGFSDTAGQRFLAPLEGEEAGLAEIEMLLTTFLQLAEASEGPSGCLVCSSSQEDIASDPDVADRINRYFERIRAAYANALSRAVGRNEITLSEDAILARTDTLFGVHVALCILGRAGRPIEQLERMVRQVLADIR